MEWFIHFPLIHHFKLYTHIHTLMCPCTHKWICTLETKDNTASLECARKEGKGSIDIESLLYARISQVVLVVKNLPANAIDVRDVCSIPGSGRSPRGGHGNPLQYSCLENLMDRGAWWTGSTGSQRVWHDWSNWPHIHCMQSPMLDNRVVSRGFFWINWCCFSLTTSRYNEGN